MKKKMISIIFMSLVTYSAPAPPPPGLPPPPSVSINKKIDFLLVAGVFFGLFWINRVRKKI